MIRLKRVGRRNDPSFRVIVTEKSRGPKSGDYLEKVGFYNPQDDTVELNKERIEHWISNGAQPSDTVHNLLISQGIIKGKKINVLPQKSPVVKEVEEKEEKKAEAPVAAEAPASEEVAEAETPKEPKEEAVEETKEEPDEVVEEAPKEEVEETPQEEETKEE